MEWFRDHMVETLLADVGEHRRRVEERSPDIPGHLIPTWEQVVNSEWTPWDDECDGDRLQVDTTDTGTAFEHLLQALRVA